MKRLSIFVVLALLSLAATSCGTSVDHGVFHVSWTVTDASGASTCAAHGANKISFLFTGGTDHAGHDEIFDCSATSGDTAPLPLDDYTYVVALLSCPNSQPGCPGGSTIKMSDPQTTNSDICDRTSGSNCIVDLPVFNFNF